MERASEFTVFHEVYYSFKEMCDCFDEPRVLLLFYPIRVVGVVMTPEKKKNI
jgi:hypothetical protein